MTRPSLALTALLLPRGADSLVLTSITLPYSSTETVHHTKHHQTYVNGLNAAEEAYGKALAASDTLNLIKLQSAMKFNGGGMSSLSPPLWHPCP